MARAQLVLRVTLMQPKGMSRKVTIKLVNDILTGQSQHIPTDWQHPDSVGVKLTETHEWLEEKK